MIWITLQIMLVSMKQSQALENLQMVQYDKYKYCNMTIQG